MPSKRTRISPQQLRLLQAAAGEPHGLTKADAYSELHGIAYRFNRRKGRGPRVPDTVKASIHRSLTKLTGGGFLRFNDADSHEGKRWHLTAEGKRLAADHGFAILTPDEWRARQTAGRTK